MKKSRMILWTAIGAIVLLNSPCRAVDGDAFSGYGSCELKQIVRDATNPVLSKNLDGNSIYDASQCRARLIYAGDWRKIPFHREAHILQWMKSSGNDPRLAKAFKEEIHVFEGSDDFWLPVENQLVADMKRDLHKGGEFMAYVTTIGAAKIRGKFDFVFLVNEWMTGN